MRRELGRTHHQVLPDKEIFFHETGRFRPLGPYLVHLALLFILAGGLIGKFWGIEGSLPIVQGQEAQAFQVGQTLAPLDFQVRLDRFQVLYYAQMAAMPKEFRSDLTFSKDGKEVLKAICRVNEPVTFGGLTFYQASYGTQPEGPVTLKVTYKERQETIQAPLRQLVELPGGEGKIMISKVDGDLQGYGPAVQGAFITGRGMGGHEMFMIFKDHPEMNQPTGPIGPYRLALESAPVQVLFRIPGETRSRRPVGLCRFSPVFPGILPGLFPAPPALGRGPGRVAQGRLAGASAGSEFPGPGGLRTPPGPTSGGF